MKAAHDGSNGGRALTPLSFGPRRIPGVLVAGLLLLAVSGACSRAAAQVLCDADGDGQVTDVDGVNALRAAAALSSLCTLATCDADGDGVVTDADAVDALRAAARLPSACGSAAAPITLTPARTTITVGESRFYTAILHHEDGSTENVTQRVMYSSSNSAVAAAANAPQEKSRVDAVAPGEATISATDPMTGLGSSPGGNATITVLGPLESLTLTPTQATLGVGESRFYTAIGHFGGGGTQNLTQRVDYFSSDTQVAVAPNTPGTKSEIQAVGAGMATISAVDSQTGVGSSPAGDATLTVLGPLESITVTPASITLAVGQSHFFTATGHFAGGATQNLTQRVDYLSSDTQVAVAPNNAGTKSEVQAVGAGMTTISARDAETGVSSSPDGDAQVTVVLP
jgi:Bacterial Ig-like domain (group 2)